jgi:CDP-diacylglycerol--glycerol-3-phosphate 3-phosphatidyltransferase
MNPWRFSAAAGATWLVLAWSFARLRRQMSAAPITPATWLTLARGLVIAIVAGFATAPIPAGALAWAPGVLYSLAALADRLDGAVARRTARVTQLGARLDVMTDAVGLLIAPLVGVRWGRLPPWYLALGLAYPTFRLALGLRRTLGWPTYPERLAPDPRARFFAGVQMTVVAAALYPVLPVSIAWTAATAAMLPTLALFAGEWRLVTAPNGARASATDGGARAQRLDP